MNLILLAAAGGAIGAAARLLVNQTFVGALYPWATITVNVVGSFLMGIVVILVAERFGGSPELRTFLATGILGGFTTFSAFSFDVVDLMTKQGSAVAALYAGGSVIGSVLALIAGLAAAKVLFT